MNTQLLKRLYNIYSPSGKEQEMIKFLSAYIRTLPGRVALTQDRYGNLYAVKGESDTYPCLVSHIDQVAHCNRSKDFRAVEKGTSFSASHPGKSGSKTWGRMTERHIHLSGMPEKIRCAQSRIFQGRGNRMQGQYGSVHAFF